MTNPLLRATILSLDHQSCENVRAIRCGRDRPSLLDFVLFQASCQSIDEGAVFRVKRFFECQGDEITATRRVAASVETIRLFNSGD
jgi:hypothetical protein